jgi:hypothetical protein
MQEMQPRCSENAGDDQIPLDSGAIDADVEKLCELRSAAAAFAVANSEESSVKMETNLAFLQPEYYMIGR